MLALVMLVLLLSADGSKAQSATADDASSPLTHGLLVVNYITWWSLDPGGYHPSILLKVENASGRDLTGQRVRFQGRFVNLRNGQVTVGREEIKRNFKPRQRLYVKLRGTDPFELPISTSDWPPIECKVMARVGEVGDEGTQNLLVTNIERVAMTDDDALHQVEKLWEFTQASPSEIQSKLPPGKPLTASPGVLKHPAAKPPRPVASPARSALLEFLHSQAMPGLADDFHVFEKQFGLPAAIEKSDPGWTWASFRHSQPDVSAIAGSRGNTGKVDILVLRLPASQITNESELLEAIRCVAGQFKGQKLGAPTRSVRYLTSGRIELVTAKTSGYQATYFTPKSAGSRDDSYTLVLWRMPGTLEKLLPEHTKRVTMLRSLAPFFEI